MLNKLKIKVVSKGIDQNLKQQEASVTLLIKEGGTPDSSNFAQNFRSSGRYQGHKGVFWQSCLQQRMQ